MGPRALHGRECNLNADVSPSSVELVPRVTQGDGDDPRPDRQRAAPDTSGPRGRDSVPTIAATLSWSSWKARAALEAAPQAQGRRFGVTAVELALDLAVEGSKHASSRDGAKPPQQSPEQIGGSRVSRPLMATLLRVWSRWRAVGGESCRQLAAGVVQGFA